MLEVNWEELQWFQDQDDQDIPENGVEGVDWDWEEYTDPNSFMVGKRRKRRV